jgi:hypothetical protein
MNKTAALKATLTLLAILSLFGLEMAAFFYKPAAYAFIVVVICGIWYAFYKIIQ